MASGDISLTTPVTKTVAGLTMQSIQIDLTTVAITFVDSLGVPWVARACDSTTGPCSGFNAGTQARFDLIVTQGYTNARSALLGPGGSGVGARIKALVQQMQTDGIIVATGTVS